MSKMDISTMSPDAVLKQVEYYIKQRSVHKNQSQKVSAHDLIKKFKHRNYGFGKKRLSYFNGLIKTIIRNNNGSTLNNVKLIVLFEQKNNY